MYWNEKNYKDQYGKPITCQEWYDTHASAKPYRDRIMKAINQLRFKGLWEDMVAGAYMGALNWKDERLYQFVCDVRLLAGMPEMSKEMYEDGRIYRHIFAGKYPYSLEEMWLLCWGDW